MDTHITAKQMRGFNKISAARLAVSRAFSTLGIKLQPFIFRGAFELRGITVKHTVWDDEFPEAPEYAHTESWDARLRTRKLTAKGLPDQRTEDRSHYASSTEELACCHAFVRLLEADKRAIFGDRFRDLAIGRHGRLEVLGERLAAGSITQEAYGEIFERIAKEFDAMVAEAEAGIRQNRV